MTPGELGQFECRSRGKRVAVYTIPYGQRGVPDLPKMCPFLKAIHNPGGTQRGRTQAEQNQMSVRRVLQRRGGSQGQTQHVEPPRFNPPPDSLARALHCAV